MGTAHRTPVKAAPAQTVSVVVPALNASATLERTLNSLESGITTGLVREVVLVDGGSTDDTVAIAARLGCNVLRAKASRGGQLRLGCEAAKGPWLLALHADTRLAGDWTRAVRGHVQLRPAHAAYFRLKFDAGGLISAIWEGGVAVRSGLFAWPYGDQGLLISKALYDAVGGYPDWPLMEDSEIVRRLGRRRLRRLPACAVTSADRYEREGWLPRSARNALIQLQWRLGADPMDLACRYGGYSSRSGTDD